MSMSFEVLGPKFPYKRLVTTQNGKSERILQKGPCPIVEICGRCPLLDMPYPKQVLIKSQKAKEYFRQMGDAFAHVSIKDCIDAPEKLAYRHSVHLMISEHTSRTQDNKQKRRIDIGYYQSKQSQVIDIGRCPIQNIQINHIVAWLRTGIRIHNVSVSSQANPDGLLDSVIITATQDGKQIFVCFIVSQLKTTGLRALACDIASKFSNIRGIFMRTVKDSENKNLKLLTGHMTVKENLFGMEREKTFHHFFAANPSMTEKLIKRIIEIQNTYENKQTFSIVTTNQYIQSVLKCVSVEESLSQNHNMICYVSSLTKNAIKDFKIFENEGYVPLFVEPFDMLPGTEYIKAITLFLKKE